MTEQALYILLLDDRKDYPNIDYWFRIVKLLGQQSPVLVVLNQKNITAATGFDWNKYKTRYGDELVLEYESINLATEPERLELVAHKVKEMLASLKHMGSELPASWLEIRKDVIDLKERNHIGLAEFKAICKKHEIVEERDQQAICNYLHMLGILLHFRNDEHLADIVFVNAQWISNAVYMILSDKDIESKSGRFQKSLLFEKWGDRYTEEEKNKLFTLMQKREFDLIYQAQDQDGARASYIAPLLLPDVAPERAARWERKGTLSFQYCYRFMPVGIITRLIVRLNQWISGSKTGQGLVWKSGVVLEKDGCLALVKTDISKKGLSLIDISIKGDSQNVKDFLAYIRGTIDEVHQQSFKNVEVELLVPCNCELCRDDADPFMFELSRLQKHLKNNRFEISCEKGETIREVPIKALLGAIEVERPIRSEFYTDRPYYGELERSGTSMRDLVELIREAKSRPQPPQPQQIIVQPPPAAEETTSPTIKTGIATWKVIVAIVGLIATLLGIGVSIKTLFYPDEPKPTATTQQTDSISAKPAQASDGPEKSKRDTKRKSR